VKKGLKEEIRLGRKIEIKSRFRINRRKGIFVEPKERN